MVSYRLVRAFPVFTCRFNRFGNGIESVEIARAPDKSGFDFARGSEGRNGNRSSHSNARRRAITARPVAARAIFLRPERVAHVLGVEVPRNEIEAYLPSLGFTVAPKNGRIAVHVPGWRPDVIREEDLIEEIARLRGYDSFPTEMRPLRPSSVPDDPAIAMESRLRRVLTGLGLHEARGYSLGPKQDESAQAVLNPLSAEEAFLRTERSVGLARAVEYHWSIGERPHRRMDANGDGVVNLADFLIFNTHFGDTVD